MCAGTQPSAMSAYETAAATHGSSCTAAAPHSSKPCMPPKPHPASQQSNCPPEGMVQVLPPLRPDVNVVRVKHRPPAWIGRDPRVYLRRQRRVFRCDAPSAQNAVHCQSRPFSPPVKHVPLQPKICSHPSHWHSCSPEEAAQPGHLAQRQVVLGGGEEVADAQQALLPVLQGNNRKKAVATYSSCMPADGGQQLYTASTAVPRLTKPPQSMPVSASDSQSFGGSPAAHQVRDGAVHGGVEGRDHCGGQGDRSLFFLTRVSTACSWSRCRRQPCSTGWMLASGTACSSAITNQPHAPFRQQPPSPRTGQ